MLSDPAHSIFISYAEEDAAARTLAQGLELEGFTTWYYTRDSVPGLEHFVQTGAAIGRAAACIILISENALASHFVEKELSCACSHERHLMPLLIGMSDDEYKRRKPVFHHAMGAARSPVKVSRATV